MKSMLESPKLVQVLVGYVEIFGTEVESDDTKLKVYILVVLPTLLYACETWTVYQRHAKRLNHFHTSCLRKLLKIKWQERIPDTEVLKRAGMQSIHTLLKLAQLRWTGHVTRMPDERLPKKILYGELQVGTRSHGGQKKWYKDTLKASLKDFNIPIESWEQIAQDRTKWRGLITRGPRATVRSPEWHSHCRYADVMQHFSNPSIATNENIIIWAVLSFEEEYMGLTVNGAWSFE